MGSSTASDKTINTSTDSAATALTSVTGTDDSMDAEPEPPEPPPQPPSLMDSEPTQTYNHAKPPSTAPPHYHRAQNSCEADSPAYTKPQSACDVIESPRPGPARFIFDVPLPDPKKEKLRNKTQVQSSIASTSIQIPYDPKMEMPKSPKASQVKYETHFKFEPEPVKRRGSEPRMKNKQKTEKEYYKDEVTKLRRQLEGTEVFTTNRRRSSAHQHSVPPPSSRRQSTAYEESEGFKASRRRSSSHQHTVAPISSRRESTTYDGTADFATGRRRSSAHQNSVPPMSTRRESIAHDEMEEFAKSRRRSSTHQYSVPPMSSRRESTAHDEMEEFAKSRRRSSTHQRSVLPISSRRQSTAYNGLGEFTRRFSVIQHLEQLPSSRRESSDYEEIEAITIRRRRSSGRQHSVPPPSPRKLSTEYDEFDGFMRRRRSSVKEYSALPPSSRKQSTDYGEAERFSTSRKRSSMYQYALSRRQSTAAQVHVTANPLDSAATTIPAGRTTIVVQQPSLSLDYGGCSTILVRDAEDARRKSRVCSDHIQQLLDVTSQFTSEDLHDFDKRYGSPHHSRSQSVKAARSRTGERQLLGLPQQRARVASMPNTGVEEEYYRLRHFSITGKGVVNRGDSLRSRRSRSNTSVASSASSTEAVTRASAPCSLASSRDSSAGLSAYRVLVLGAPGVGKSSLVGQFMTSEYLHAYDTSIDDESGERSVCVLLAGEESEITFLDSPPDHIITEGCAHGYCVVYSTADRSSFAEAERRLQTLWAAGHTARRAVILVGNKADLARSRVVNTDEGKTLATAYECKFIETSVGINHNVDELLVGLLTQIRLKQQHAERVRKRSTSRKNRSRTRSPMDAETPAPAPAPPSASAASTPRKRTRLSASVKVRGLLGRVWARDSKSKSCENLHVL